MFGRRTLALITTTLLIGAVVPRAAAETPYWPSDQEAHLEELDTQLLETQQKLFAARQENDTDAANELAKTFKDCQEKRLKLLRAMGQLPKND